MLPSSGFSGDHGGLEQLHRGRPACNESPPMADHAAKPENKRSRAIFYDACCSYVTCVQPVTFHSSFSSSLFFSYASGTEKKDVARKHRNASPAEASIFTAKTTVCRGLRSRLFCAFAHVFLCVFVPLFKSLRRYLRFPPHSSEKLYA